MITEATKEILSLVEVEEERKKSLQLTVKQLEGQKRQRQAIIAAEQLTLIGIQNLDQDQSAGNYGYRLLRVMKGVSKLIETEHVLSDKRKEFARVDNAIGETMHWTALSEHDNQRDRVEAINLARQSMA